VKPKIKSIKAYEDTLKDIKAVISTDPRMTIIRFYDEAAKEKLEKLKQKINEQ
jgi:hypothetical protein